MESITGTSLSITFPKGTPLVPLLRFDLWGRGVWCFPGFNSPYKYVSDANHQGNPEGLQVR